MKCNGPYVSKDGWLGIPTASIRASLVSAAQLAGIPKTRVKTGIRVLADGVDTAGTPLVRITKGKPTCLKIEVRYPKWPGGV